MIQFHGVSEWLLGPISGASGEADHWDVSVEYSSVSLIVSG